MATTSDERDGGDALAAAPRRVAVLAGAVEQAYLDHYAAVFRYSFALTGSAADAEDVTSEVFERALRAWTETPARPLAWLLLTTRRIATDRFRRAARLVSVLARLRSREPRPAEIGTDFSLWFSAVGAVLTPRQREVLVLRYEREMTDGEIGELLGVSASGARSLMARALATLRAHPELL
jgi:RNA polymerase sigma factor (sigma-70 family)